MCGIAGFVRTQSTFGRDEHYQWLEAMAQSIFHRGPDAGGFYQDDQVSIAHRRLSILDLSEAGSQPMVSASGRYIIAYNGEIYNYRELKEPLEDEGYRFKSGTDTEVVLALFEKEGLECLSRLNGMFAIALWDTEKNELFLARDRLGKKPLYYYEADGQFAFASELKALYQLPFVKRDIDLEAVKDFFAHQYVPDPKTIFRNLHKLSPGHWLKTDGLTCRIHQYWDVSFDSKPGRTTRQITDGLYDLIDDAVRLRMISDVPLGAFLSGGVDSSAVVGLMAGQSQHPVTTCSIGFDSKNFDEVVYARQVAEQFHTSHNEFTVRENVADNLSAIARFFDEPFADPSFVPTYFVSKLAREKVTVALAGDGGDENFAGYSKYRTDAVENQLRGLFPSFLRRTVFPSMARAAGTFNTGLGRKAHSLLGTLAQDPDTAFFTTNCFFRQSVWDRLITSEVRQETASYDPADITRFHYRNANAEDHLSRILYTDIKTYLPGDILVKVDRMSMANSLETRAPLLDYRVVEYAAGIPASLKLHGKEKKHILKETFSDLLTADILYRKKMGFSVPLAQWLRDELFSVANDTFTSEESGLARVFNMSAVNELWEAHQIGDDRYTQELWSMLAFELWWQAYCV